MTESKEHKREKNKAAGKKGKTEVPLKSGRRLDAINKKKATEVERSGSKVGFKKSVARLKEAGKKAKVLVVPKKDIRKAKNAVGSRSIKIKPI